MAQIRNPVRTRANQYGFFPAATADYTEGQEPEIARRLDRLGKSLRLHLVGLSGWRSPAHSVEVGGFADDPHTRGQASDTPGVESVPESVLRRFGLTRPFAGSSEADHIQLLGGARGTTRNMQPKGKGFTLGELWTQAGGPRNLAPIMSAIGLAESGGRVDAVGGPNNDGTYDYGLFQINSSHSQYDANKLVSDPLYNARAAVAIWRSQGLGAWSTYNSGAYRGFMGQGSTVKNSGPGRVRPGGDTPGDNTQGIDTAFSDYLQESDGTGSNQNVSWGFVPGINVPLPGFPDFNPLKGFNDAKNAVKSVDDFLKWIAWLFHPRNVLRLVEFLSGFTLMVLGIHSAIQVHMNAETDIQKVARAPKRAVKTAASVVPAGRVARTSARVKGRVSGAQSARAASLRKEGDDARVGTRKKMDQTQRQTRSRRKQADRKYGKNAPF